MQTVVDVFTEFAARLGLDTGLNRDGMIELVLDQDVSVTFELSADKALVCFYADVIAEPKAADAAYYRHLLGMNCFRLGTAATWLALNEDSASVMIAGMIPASILSPDMLADIVMNLADEVARLRDMLSPAGAAPVETFDMMGADTIRG